MDLNFSGAIFVPFPSFDVSQPLPTSNKDRLRTILKNLDEHHAQVRGNMVALATEYSETLATNRLDAPMSDTQDISYLIESLLTPDSKHDPALRPGQKPPRPPITSTGRERNGNARETSEYIRLARRTLRELEEYDKRAAKTRELYEDALRRMGAGVSPVNQAPNLTGGVEDDEEHSNKHQGVTTQGVIKSLDPRLRRPSIPAPAVGAQVVKVGSGVEDEAGTRSGRSLDPRLRGPSIPAPTVGAQVVKVGSGMKNEAGTRSGKSLDPRLRRPSVPGATIGGPVVEVGEVEGEMHT